MLEVKDKAAALKYTRVAQVMFVVAGGAAAAVAFVGGPRGAGSSAEKYTPGAVAINLPGEKPAADMDLASASARMGLIGNAPRPVLADPPPNPDPVDNKQPEQEKPKVAEGGSGDVIQYLGPVRLGTKTLALLSIHGKQRFAAVNDATDDGTVTEITSEHITLTLREVERKIDRAARGTEVVTRVSAAGGAPRGGMPRTAAMGQPRPAQPPMPVPMAQPIQPMAQPMAQDPGVHYEDIRTRLKASGQFQNEDELAKAAKGELERQIMGGKPPEKGPK